MLIHIKVGYRAVFDAPLIITHITFCLHSASLRLHTLVSEVLAALCVLSPTEGEKLVLHAFSEYRVAHAEIFRFENLVKSLKFGVDDDSYEADSSHIDDDGLWEAKTATMTLINALSNYPDDLEERVLIREEFSRRGLNEAIVVSRDALIPARLALFNESWYEGNALYRAAGLSS